MRPVIGITCNYDQSGGLFCLRDYYTYAVSEAGGMSLLLPAVCDLELCPHYLEVCDGVLLSGGGDVDPFWFGQDADMELGEINPARDAFEIRLAQLALSRGKPALGICRGCQIMNIAAGGTLVQDIKSSRLHEQIAPRDYPIHDILIEEGSRLNRIMGTDRIRVNSFHHQAIDVPGENMAISAWATDGIVEAIESRDKPFYLGVQWHPECMRDHYSHNLFAALVEK
ncbi:MAG TPA: gamma-glutamyl-gamma-aminobutyrate hydrolase family protein, partial [Syntrophomonas sp.]|nr:gamma-glutamyl-gamma-aminobutyrate hydrolase family protein [Syntrophomonas sp.]